KEALNQQIEDRNWLEELEQKRAIALAQDAIRNDKIPEHALLSSLFLKK
ncbi:unnamed protein product, partial [Rotaria sordida]